MKSKMKNESYRVIFSIFPSGNTRLCSVYMGVPGTLDKDINTIAEVSHRGAE